MTHQINTELELTLIIGYFQQIKNHKEIQELPI